MGQRLSAKQLREASRKSGLITGIAAGLVRSMMSSQKCEISILRSQSHQADIGLQLLVRTRRGMTLRSKFCMYIDDSNYMDCSDSWYVPDDEEEDLLEKLGTPSVRATAEAPF